MKKQLVWTIIALLVVSVARFNVRVVAAPAVIRVPDDYPTIQEAINAVSSGGTILVKEGIYDEDITIPKSLSLRGENRNTTIIDGGIWIYPYTSNVKISGFTIRNASEHTNYNGIYTNWKNTNITIFDNILRDHLHAGIMLKYLNTGNLVASNLIINCSMTGIEIAAHSHHNEVVNNTIDGKGGEFASEFGKFGIEVSTNSSSNTVSQNRILNMGWEAIGLSNSSKNLIEKNVITNSDIGILIYSPYSPDKGTTSSSRNNILRENNIISTKLGFGVEGSLLREFIHDIDTTNTVNGKPIYYLIGQKNLLITASTFPDIGYLGLINSTNIMIRDITFQDNWQGLLMVYTKNSTIQNVNFPNYYNFVIAVKLSERISILNSTISGKGIQGRGVSLERSEDCIIRNSTISKNQAGIYLSNSNCTIIFENTISDSMYKGLELSNSHNNTIYHNNFAFNPVHVTLTDSFDNIWDDGYPSGGNYWSDYTGEDLFSGPYQNEKESDGIGDTPYIIDDYNHDNYPLMSPYGIGEKPVAQLSASPTTVKEDVDYVEFDASASYDPDGSIVSYWYDYGDDSNSSWISEVTHCRSYPDRGEYYARVMVRDNDGLVSEWSDTIRIIVTPSLSLIVTFNFDPTEVQSEQTSTLTVTVTDGTNTIKNATVTLSSEKGFFEQTSGTTNSNGKFVTTFFAPAVTEQTTIKITVTASKSGYLDGYNHEYITVYPDEVPTEILLWVTLSTVVIIVAIVAITRRRRGARKYQTVEYKPS